MKILVRMTNWVGDCLIATPALRYLRQTHPDAEINILVKENLSSLFEDNPNINRVVGFKQRKGFYGISDRISLVKSLRRVDYDAVYIFPRSWDSALIPFLAGIPQRIGYASCGRGLLLTQKYKRTREIRRKHQSEYYMNLITGIPNVFESEKKADLVINPYLEQWGKDYFEEHFSGKRVVGIAPGATYGSAKMWLVDRYEEVARRLLQEAHVGVLLFGGAKEAEWIEPLTEKVPGLKSMAGKTNLMELAALMKQCNVVLTNDSGPMHVAAAVGAPMVVLFGPTRYENTHPMGEHTLIHKRVACSPCMLRQCPIDHRCMTQISVDEVVKAVLNKVGEVISELKVLL